MDGTNKASSRPVSNKVKISKARAPSAPALAIAPAAAVVLAAAVAMEAVPARAAVGLSESLSSELHPK